MYQMLIADDDQFVLDGLKEEIDWKKYNIYAVECCTNGKQALEILKQQQIDIILTDIRMPGVDGLELTKAAMEQNPEICVVIMSGHSEFEYAHTAIRLGVYDYLLKPITLDAIDSLFMRLTKELENTQKQLAGVQAKLHNEQFTSKAPAHIVQNQRDAAAKLEEKIQMLEQSLAEMAG